jgi:phosphoribosylaminoimidazole carboxylase (NCAIR synthetase)
VVTPQGIAAVEAIVKENRRVTVNEIAAYLGMSHGSAHRTGCDFFCISINI